MKLLTFKGFNVSFQQLSKYKIMSMSKKNYSSKTGAEASLGNKVELNTNHPMDTSENYGDSPFREGLNHDGKNNSAKNGSRSTLIEEEVAKFRKMADSWWDHNGDCKPLHSLNKLRVPFILNGIKNNHLISQDYTNGPKPLDGIKILDVGCGGGLLCEPLARLGASVIGLDAAEENVSAARLHADLDPRVKFNIKYVQGTIEKHAATISNKYDVVIASEVLEHVDDAHFFIQTCVDILKPGASIFCTTINKTYQSWLGAIVLGEYCLRLLPVGTHDWHKFILQEDLVSMLENNGCVTRVIHGMVYNPIKNQWGWSSNVSINYAIHAIKEA